MFTIQSLEYNTYVTRDWVFLFSSVMHAVFAALNAANSWRVLHSAASLASSTALAVFSLSAVILSISVMTAVGHAASPAPAPLAFKKD